jgi:hypothetical protein
VSEVAAIDRQLAPRKRPPRGHGHEVRRIDVMRPILVRVHNFLRDRFGFFFVTQPTNSFDEAVSTEIDITSPALSAFRLPSIDPGQGGAHARAAGW